MMNRRGGKRANSGRKRKNKTWGQPGEVSGQSVLNSFFHIGKDKQSENLANSQEEEDEHMNQEEQAIDLLDIDTIPEFFRFLIMTLMNTLQR